MFGDQFVVLSRTAMNALALHSYQLAVDQGDAEAQFMLGACYHEGKGVVQDFQRAVYFYQLAANQGRLVCLHFNQKFACIDEEFLAKLMLQYDARSSSSIHFTI